MSFPTIQTNQLEVSGTIFANNIVLETEIAVPLVTQQVSIRRSDNNAIVADTAASLYLQRYGDMVICTLKKNDNDLVFTLADANITYYLALVSNNDPEVIPDGYKPTNLTSFGMPYVKGGGQAGNVIFATDGSVSFTNFNGVAFGGGDVTYIPAAHALIWRIP